MPENLSSFLERIGANRDLALAVGVSAHLVQLGNLVLLGMLGHLGMAIYPRPESLEV